jgi:hypothetical protein
VLSSLSSSMIAGLLLLGLIWGLYVCEEAETSELPGGSNDYRFDVNNVGNNWRIRKNA